jgi:hypothetical protein
MCPLFDKPPVIVFLLYILSPRAEGSVLLSSLLESDRAVFAHLALAIELFALFPLWCRHITAFHPVRSRVPHLFTTFSCRRRVSPSTCSSEV